MRKNWSRPLAILLLTLIVASVSTAALAENITLKFMAWGNWTKFEPIFEAFKAENPGIDIEVIPGVSFGTYISKIQVMQASGVFPDVMKLSGAFVPNLASNDGLLALDPYIKRDKVNMNDFLPTGDVLRYKNVTYGFGEGYSISGLLYNKDMFVNSGVSFPDGTWTWDDQLTASKKLTRRNEGDVEVYGFQVWAEEAYNGFGSYQFYIPQAGGQILNADKTRAAFNSPEGLKGLKYMVGLVESGVAAPPATAGRYSFDTGTNAMEVGIFPNGFGSLRESAGFDWDVAPLAKGKEAATVQNTVGMGISSGSAHKEEAWKLLKFIVTEGQIIEAKAKTAFPVYKPAIKYYVEPGVKPVSYMDFLTAMTPVAKDLNFTLNWSDWVAVLGNRISEAVAGKTAPENALIQAEQEVNAILADVK